MALEYGTGMSAILQNLDIVRPSRFHLESIWMLVAGPDSSFRVEEEAFLVLLADVVVQVLRNAKLTMELREFNELTGRSLSQQVV